MERKYFGPGSYCEYVNKQIIRFSRRPSDEAKTLMDQFPDLVGRRENGGICSSAMANFVGSLVYALHQQELNDLVTQAGYPLDEKALNPAYVLTDVPLYRYYDDLGCSQNIGTTGESVLVKQVCGSEEPVGLVIKGPYAGLILRWNKPLGSPCNVVRFIGDEVVRFDYHQPYVPFAVTNDPEMRRNDRKGILPLLDKEIAQRLWKLCDEYYLQTYGKSETCPDVDTLKKLFIYDFAGRVVQPRIYYSDVLGHLLNLLHIPHDPLLTVLYPGV